MLALFCTSSEDKFNRNVISTKEFFLSLRKATLSYLSESYTTHYQYDVQVKIQDNL